MELWTVFFIFLIIKLFHFRYIEVPSGHHVELTITDFEVISLLLINLPPPLRPPHGQHRQIPDGELLRPSLHHLGHLPVWLLVLLQILQRLSVHAGKTPNEKQTVNILPSDHNILISWPDWSQPQVFNDFRKKFSFIFTYFLTSPPRIFHTTHFHFPFIFKYFLTPSPRMYSDGSVTKKGWSINWRAIPDWSSPIITISTLWPPKLAPILTADRRVHQWICFNQSANKYSMKIYHRLRFIFQFWTIHQSFFSGTNQYMS